MKGPKDYILRVRCGPNYDESNLKYCHVNDEFNPTLVDGPLFVGYICVRMLNYDGLVSPDHPSKEPIKNCTSNYFKGKHRRYSIMVQGRFKEPINGDDILFGIDSDRPSRLPTGVGLAIKVAKWLDPAVEADVYCSTPYIYSPLICAMNSLGAFSLESAEINDDVDNQSGKLLVEDINRNPCLMPTQEPSLPIGKWSFHSRMIPEDVSLLVEAKDKSTDSLQLFKKTNKLGSYEKRKKYFADIKHRQQVTLSPDHVYCMDFYDAYFDIHTISLKLPGVSISGFKYWDGQPIRYAAKSRSDPTKTYFTVWFELVDRDLFGLPPLDSIEKPCLLDPKLETSSVHMVPEEILKEEVEKMQIIDDDSGNEEFEDALE